MIFRFLYHLVLIVLGLSAIFILFFLSTIFFVNQVYDFCDSLEVGDKYSEVLESARDVFGAELNQISLSGDVIYLHSSWVVGATCAMRFDEKSLIAFWKESE